MKVLDEIYAQPNGCKKKRSENINDKLMKDILIFLLKIF